MGDRVVKFRGKRVDNGEWVFGDYSRYSKYKSTIMVDLLEEEDYWVLSETVGQYTGLKDKNGVEIYEGDVVTACWYDYEEPNHDMTGIVEFTEGWMSYWIADYDKKEFSELNGQGYCHWTIEVIDNIYDNPELMEGEL